MKKILLICLLMSGFVNAQFTINDPTPYYQCDLNNDNFETFSLALKKIEILSGLNAENYEIYYYESLSNAQLDINRINFENYIYSSNNATNTIFIRVHEIANTTNFQLTTLEFFIIASPTSNDVPNLYQENIPYTGTAVFDLSVQSQIIIGSQSDVSVAYFTSYSNANNNSNPISNITAYSNTANPQAIYTRVTNNITNCYVIKSFSLVLTNPEIVTISDVNFKSLLLHQNPSYSHVAYDDLDNPVIIDTNGDGLIQITETQGVKRLFFGIYSLNVDSLDGINSFSNLNKLWLFNLNTTSIELSNLLNLELIVINESFTLTSLTINNLPSLKNLEVANNYSLSDLSLNLINNVERINFNNDNLTQLDLSNFLSLKELYCNNNNLTTLDLTNLSLLERLYCNNNNIENLNLSNQSNLLELYCNNNNLSSINTSSSLNLEYLSCEENVISSIIVNPNVYSIICGLNLLEELDFSNNFNLTIFHCGGNPLLKSINLNNGKPWNAFYTPGNLSFNQNYNLEYICVGESSIDNINLKLSEDANFNVEVNSYCSFPPGGDYNTITGTIQYDFNNNGCDSSDPNANYQGLAVSIDAVSTNSSVYSNGLGVYNLFTSNPGVYGLNPNLENLSYFNVTPSPAEVPVMTIDNSTVTQNFCISANGVHPDLEVVIAPVIPARPGFQAVYKLVYKNKGNQVMSQNYGLNFFYNHNLMSLVSTSVVPSAQTTGGLQWDYANLMPFESRSILVTFLINAPTDTTNPVNIDDVLTFTSVISPQAGDETVTDNTFVYNQTVVGSYDPNDITCLQGNLVLPTLIGEYLHYMIRFENTGTAAAENIVVKAEIDATQYNINSLQMLAASHNATIKRTGNILEFIFQDIQLDSGGHGNILLKIQSNGSLVEGDSVTESAAIYFDYNFPVITNDEETVFATLSMNNPNVDATVSLYPNPVKDVVTIRSVSQIQSIQLYDVQGRLLQTMVVDTNDYQFNLSERTTGVYFVKITTDSGVKIEKMSKE